MTKPIAGCLAAALASLIIAATTSTAAAGVAWCLKSDMNGDRLRNAADLPLFVSALVNGPADDQQACAGDSTMDDRVDGRDIADFIRYLVAPDTDGDGIPDIFETNDGIVAGPTAIGTDPADDDTDGDAIRDGDEVYPTTAGLDLRSMGANAVRKDIFVESDWFDDGAHTHRLNSTVVSLLVAAYAAATTPNPYDAPPGIGLHIDYGQGGAFTGGNLIPGGDTVVLFDSEFNVYKAAHFNDNRRGYFHYSINCHRYNSETNNSSGVAELNGNDFIVSLQSSLSNSNVSKTFMHELGHNIGLRHGGFENRNRKPNYNSVMNYRFQFPGADTNCNAIGDGILDYSHGLRIPLDENDLDETQGVCGTVGIDWDGSGSLTSGVQRNINCNTGTHQPCGTGTNCSDSTCNVLLDSDDWSMIYFAGINGGDFVGPEIIECQDTP